MMPDLETPSEQDGAVLDARARYMKRYYIVATASIMAVFLIAVCALWQVLSWSDAALIGALILLIMLAFYGLFRSGVHRRFADPSLTLAQMVAASAVVFYALYAAHSARAVFLMLFLMIYTFGMLGLTTATLLRFAAFVLGGYGLIIGLLVSVKPATLNWRLECLQWLALAITQLSLAWMGGVISALRRRASDSKQQLQTLLAQVRQSEASLNHAQRIAEVGSWTIDPTSRSASWSAETYRLFKIDPGLPAPIGGAFLDLLHPDDRDHIADVLRRALRDGVAFEEQFRVRSADGVVLSLQARGRPVRHASGILAALSGTVMDITDRIEREAAIGKLAFYDGLTGLPNRRLLLDRLAGVMAASARAGHHCALLFLDLDNFKTINDTFGHDIGDRLLQLVAQRLADLVRPEHGLAVRLGGDEFVVMLRELGAERAQALEQTRTHAHALRVALGQPFDFLGQTYRQTASIGASVFQGDQMAPDECLKEADMAMYEAKSAGKNDLRIFDPQIGASARRRADFAAQLQRGWDLNQFALYYQPVVNAHGDATGAEVSLRWLRPGGEAVAQADFTPVAEQSGLMVPLCNWSIEEACQQLARWSANPATARLTLAVSVNPRQFQAADFAASVQDVLRASGAEARLLRLGIGEAMLIDDVHSVESIMHALKALGVGLILDDFCTGLISLTALGRLPFDFVKIDRAVCGAVEPANMSMTGAIIGLAHKLNFGVIVQGVETMEQWQVLKQQGCHAFQGGLFGAPGSDVGQPVSSLLFAAHSG